MGMVDRDIHLCRALVIDSNPTSRSILVAQLRDFGVGTVVQCGRVTDARAQLEARAYDVVLCEQGFKGTEQSGQQLLDDLRRNQLLPLSTVFVMITAEASYAKVAEAAESALDSYLLKPHTAAALAERIRQARRRKKVLQDIFVAVDEGRFDDAAQHCLARFRAQSEYWIFAARIGAELLLNLQRLDEARALYDEVLKTQALPWARLGIARTHLEAAEHGKAMRTLESLIGEHPGFVDAYDVMGRAHVEQGELEAATDVYRQAAALTPGSVGRQQKLGMLAFYTGDREVAARALERAVSLGIGSKMFDFQTLVLLAFARFHASDTKGLQRCADNLAHALSRAPESTRLIRFSKVVRVLCLMLHKQVAEAIDAIRELAGGVREPSFDFEAASNLTALLAQLTAAELRLDRVEEWVDAIALRHSASRSLTELLVRSASAHAPFAERVKACHHRITHIAEKAMAHSLAGDPGAAVRGLLQQGRSTLNGKLVDTARAVLLRHHARIADAAALDDEIERLRREHAVVVGRMALGEAGGRKAGGLALRTSAAPADAAAAPDAALADAA